MGSENRVKLTFPFVVLKPTQGSGFSRYVQEQRKQRVYFYLELRRGRESSPPSQRVTTKLGQLNLHYAESLSC